MDFEIWLLYLATVLLFMCTPGPSHLLMLSNSLSNGFRKSTATAAAVLLSLKSVDVKNSLIKKRLTKHIIGRIYEHHCRG